MYNRMSDVVNKIERRLGTAPLGLQPELAKENCLETTIDTRFSNIIFSIDE